MKKSKNKTTIILAVVLIALLAFAYKMMFMESGDISMPNVENVAASARVEILLRQVENINFDTSIIQDQKFQSLKSFEIPLPSLPIGRKNPFSNI